MEHKISIIVPVYGVEKYIAQCAHSLFQQTYPNIEYIFVDDCSKDNSISILEEIINEYPERKKQVTIIRKESNGGLPQARKTGYVKATGEYLIHIDSDDWIEINMIESLYNKAVTEDLDVVWCDYYEDYSDHSNYINTSSISYDKISILKRFFSLTNNLHSGVWNKLVHRKIYTNSEVFFPIANQNEDFVLTIQNIYFSDKIGHLNRALYHYRFNIESLSWDKSRKIKKVVERYSNISLTIKFIEEKFANDIFLLEPEISQFTNTLKTSIMLYRETRDVQKLFDLYQNSNANIFLPNPKLQFYKKIFLYLAVRNITFQYRIFDMFRF